MRKMDPRAPTLPSTQTPANDKFSYSREHLLDRARALVPLLSERAIDTCESRRIPEKTITDFWEAGLFQLLKPKKFNGPEVRADIVFEIAAILAKGDGSAAWVWNLLGMHDLFVALLPEQAQHEYWANDRTLGASSFAANGRAKTAKGGFSLSGKWSFCSGVDCADWMLLGAKCDPSAIPAPSAGPDSRSPEVRWVLIPKSDCRVVDDWHVLGLRGTGSKSIMVDEAFVPEHRTVRYDQLVIGQAPGGKLHPNPLYRAPLWAVFTLGICAPAVGIARGASESFIQEMKTRVWGMDYAPQAKNPAIQLRLAEATAMIDAADLLYHRASTQMIDKIMNSETPSVEDRIRSRRDQAYAVKTATRAVELLLDAQGGKGLYEGGQVQRAFRDLHAMSAHIMAGWDMPALSYGQVTLGGVPTNPFY
ncbi:MAG TPA: acyl-CoA dehydrogenase family protein [Tepidisphaeraceae bacterium]|jgi:3-hydroxy-9,10-secoandrosta-1,3,5(10)-triene-9,17-dione monooxygenase